MSLDFFDLSMMGYCPISAFCWNSGGEYAENVKLDLFVCPGVGENPLFLMD